MFARANSPLLYPARVGTDAPARPSRAKRGSSLRKNPGLDFVLKGRGFSLRKNPGLDFVLKGRGFSRAVSSATSNGGFSRRGQPRRAIASP